jgi:hypothetical protein
MRFLGFAFLHCHSSNKDTVAPCHDRYFFLLHFPSFEISRIPCSAYFIKRIQERSKAMLSTNYQTHPMPKRSDFLEGVRGTMKWSPAALLLKGGERGVGKSEVIFSL